MYDRQIPRAEWFNFFQGFSKRHDEWPVTVRIVSPRFGAQVEACELPLEGIVADRVGGGPISIHIGHDAGRHIEHEVVNPIQVWVEVADNGTEEALEIESNDGTKTLVLFGPETVDDVLRRA